MNVVYILWLRQLKRASRSRARIIGSFGQPLLFLLAFGFPRPGVIGGDDFVAQMTTVSTVFTIYYLLIVPIGIGFLSHAYRHFFQGGLQLPE